VAKQGRGASGDTRFGSESTLLIQPFKKQNMPKMRIFGKRAVKSPQHGGSTPLAFGGGRRGGGRRVGGARAPAGAPARGAAGAH